MLDKWCQHWRKAYMNRKYIVASLVNRTTRAFDHPNEVAQFMFGRKLTEWAIYQRQDDLPTSQQGMEKLLELRELIKNTV